MTASNSKTAAGCPTRRRPSRSPDAILARRLATLSILLALVDDAVAALRDAPLDHLDDWRFQRQQEIDGDLAPLTWHTGNIRDSLAPALAETTAAPNAHLLDAVADAVAAVLDRAVSEAI